jgi:hypothetical protein
MQRLAFVAALGALACLLAAPAEAWLSRNGQASVGGTSPVQTTFQNGQTFVTWPDVVQCASGSTSCPGNANYRYSMYRSTSPLSSSNCTSGTLVASSIANNSAQLIGGNPNDNGGDGESYTQANRQNSTLPQVVLSYQGTPLSIYSGLQVYTATATQSAYYCIMANPFPSGTAVYVGAAGPVSESAATPAATPIKWADSLSRGQTYGKITCSTSCGSQTVIFRAHASNSSGGAPPGFGEYGDYWEWYLTPQDGWQDGRDAVLTVAQDNAQDFPAETSVLWLAPRDTVWYPNYNSTSGGIETAHYGLGLDKNGTNALYLTTMSGYQKFLNFVVSHYGANANNLHWVGTSMGAWGGANTGVRMTNPQFAGVWVTFPLWRFDHKSSTDWAGLTWPGGSNAQPFSATLGSAPSTLGSSASAVNVYPPNASAQPWGGNGNYADTPNFIASSPGTDLPFVMWDADEFDGYSNWPDQITAVNAFESANRGYAFGWSFGAHGEDDQDGRIAVFLDCDQSGATAYCYHKNSFQLNLAYLAFSGSSINDNPGTGTVQANGLFDGSYKGLMNAGFSWNISADTTTSFNFTVSNSWMGLTPTADPTTTLTQAIPASGGGTFNVANGSVFQSVSGSAAVAQPYFLISGTEVVCLSATAAGSITITESGFCSGGGSGGRGQFGTTAQTHNIGDTVEQILLVPTGPLGGPYSSMTASITPRRRQGFLPTSGKTVSCTVTPNGGSPQTMTATVQSDGLFTFTSFPINSSGSTTATCTHS